MKKNSKIKRKKPMGFSKSRAKREIHSNKSLPPEPRETSNKQPNITLNTTKNKNPNLVGRQKSQ